jgi:hypothetical protein
MGYVASGLLVRQYYFPLSGHGLELVIANRTVHG